MVNCPERDLDLMFGALSNASRRCMIASLRSGEASVESLGKPLSMSTPLVMKHLSLLERSGLVVTEKRGRTRYCRLEVERLAEAEGWIAEMRTFWAGSLSRLQKHLGSRKEKL